MKTRNNTNHFCIQSYPKKNFLNDFPEMSQILITL